MCEGDAPSDSCICPARRIIPGAVCRHAALPTSNDGDLPVCCRSTSCACSSLTISSWSLLFTRRCMSPQSCPVFAERIGVTRSALGWSPTPFPALTTTTPSSRSDAVGPTYLAGSRRPDALGIALATIRRRCKNVTKGRFAAVDGRHA